MERSAAYSSQRFAHQGLQGPVGGRFGGGLPPPEALERHPREEREIRQRKEVVRGRGAEGFGQIRPQGEPFADALQQPDVAERLARIPFVEGEGVRGVRAGTAFYRGQVPAFRKYQAPPDLFRRLEEPLPRDKPKVIRHSSPVHHAVFPFTVTVNGIWVRGCVCMSSILMD